MAEAALLAVGKKVLEKLADLIAQEISLAWSAKEELKKLQGSLDTIKDTFQAFEEGQYVQTSPTNNWLGKLKDVVYDAEDVLDEFATEVSRQRMEQICFCTLDEVWEFSSRLLYYFKLGHQIKEIRERLKKITIDKNDFHPPTQPIFPTSVANNETGPSLPNPSSVIGRNEEKDAIVKRLTEFESAQNVPVIPIVGMPGVGKTTLARSVFNDERVKKHFDDPKFRIWVHVSDDFDEKTIAKRIIEYITEEKCDELQLGVVQHLLGVQLNEKRYLLVLDDVWNDIHAKWVPVKNLLNCGKEGSSILVTTPSYQVAELMSPITTQHCRLEPLSNEVDCWSMFKQRAFHEGDEEKYKTTLVPIGEQIVRKCQGVPLAIIALGSLLNSEKTESYWRYVRDNEIWKLTEDVKRNQGQIINILPILKFSYNHLPLPLKACFGFCSLFPKDYEINRRKLILLWMANGLIQPSIRRMEDVGNDYFHILLSRTFFQDAEEYDDGSIRSCKMHDLMHDLARSITGTEYLIAGEVTEAPQGGDITSPEGSARHMWLSGEFNPQLFNTANKSRTLLKPDKLELPLPYNKCLNFKRLRALDLSCSNLGRLPDSICELKHLRYLDLSYSRIRALPDSFSRLQNLQTLIVLGCRDLEALPKDMWKMVKLRHIINQETYLTHMPSGLGQLSSLQTLELFVVGDKIGSKISELGPLDGLRDYLCILALNHVTDPADAVKASLEKKEHLYILTLEWNSEHMWTGQQQDESILECLHPPTNLKELVIYNYGGVKFPDWRMSTLERLVSIDLHNFSGCQHLSALGELPSLQFLSLEYILDLECIDGGFMSLKQLWLEYLPKLKKWGGQFLSLPCLTTLVIRNCPSLVAMPFFPSLETWNLEFGRGQLLLQSLTSNHPSSTLSGILTLKSLDIVECDDLERLPADGLQNLVSLERLSISKCSSLKSLSEDVLQHLSALRSLSIDDCPMLTTLPISQYITYLSLRHCRNATWLEAEAEESLSDFRSLRYLSMSNLPKVVFLPNALQHATSLECLQIFDCYGLTTIPEWIANLASLQELVLIGCLFLTCLPEGMKRLTRIQNLKIGACPDLCWRCQRVTGDDWAKIAHIQNIIISEGWDI